MEFDNLQKDRLKYYLTGKEHIAEELSLIFLKIEDISKLIDYNTIELSKLEFKGDEINNSAFIQSMLNLVHIYHLCCLFPNENILSHFKKSYGFKDATLKWFTSYLKILVNIDNINRKQEFYLDPYTALVCLDEYFYYKILHTVVSSFYDDKKYDGILQSVMAIELIKVYQNRENRNKAGKFSDKTFIDTFVGDIDELFQILIEKQKIKTSPKKLLKNLFNGKVENLVLIELYKKHSVTLKPTISERKKQLAFFDLLKLLLKEKKWLSREEWEELDEPLYETYENYMVSCVKKFIYKK